MDFKEVLDAKERLQGIIQPTPLIKSPVFSGEYGNEVYLKPENFQVTGAFKIRGAYNKVASLSDSERSRGLISASAGNHAQGVAYSAQKLGVKAKIIMPSHTPLIKTAATKAYGVEVLLSGSCYDDAYETARTLEKEEGLCFVHPFDDAKVIAGQGTIALEILEELPDADILLVPIGGGGLAAGIALAAKHVNPSIQVIGVEPERAASMYNSKVHGKVKRLRKVETIAEGVAVKEPGKLTYDLIQKYLDEILLVSDYDIMEEFLVLLEKHKIVAEAAGVLSLAALKKLTVQNKKIVCVLSGGNIDVVTMAEMINRGLVTRGRLCCFQVELPDVPGQMLKIAGILAEHQANIIKLDHDQFKTIDRFRKVVLEVTAETSGKEHVALILQALRQEGYHVEVIY